MKYKNSYVLNFSSPYAGSAEESLSNTLPLSKCRLNFLQKQIQYSQKKLQKAKIEFSKKGKSSMGLLIDI